MGWDTFLGYFFTNSSGHLDRKEKIRLFVESFYPTFPIILLHCLKYDAGLSSGGFCELVSATICRRAIFEINIYYYITIIIILYNNYYIIIIILLYNFLTIGIWVRDSKIRIH
jgi:hypothetical protein